jgi:nicotinate-nucleotide pyrophosphorylase (carboxylating)
MSLVSLPNVMLEPLVRAALLEDLGRAGDLTTSLIVPATDRARMVLRARQPGVVAGLDLAALAFRLVDPDIAVSLDRPDGSHVVPGDIIGTVEGPARGLLTAERVALNFLGHLSGIASVTHAIVAAVKPHRTQIVDTRKTTPGLRMIEKYAVRVGGGANHRFGLDDAVLIKDNHIAVAGSIAAAVERVRAGIGHLVKIEVEVDTLDQLAALLPLPVDAVLLDNMTPHELRQAVALVAGRFVTEASGRVTPESAPAIAASGVDLISVGWVTHSAPVLDIGLDFERVTS